LGWYFIQHSDSNTPHIIDLAHEQAQATASSRDDHHLLRPIKAPLGAVSPPRVELLPYPKDVEDDRIAHADLHCRIRVVEVLGAHGERSKTGKDGVEEGVVEDT